MTPKKFQELLPVICDRATSQDRSGWTSENPLWGHCAVVSVVAQNLFGGRLMRISLEKVPGFEHIRSHYFNELPNGEMHDFTAAQFGQRYPDRIPAQPKDRSYVLSFSETAKRYKLLAYRLAKQLNPGNALFDDLVYQECFCSALDSDCQKMWFGCVATCRGEIIAKTYNKRLEPLKYLCDPVCVRLSIQSRTESMIGACGHAEELALWEIANRGLSLKECELWIAGLNTTGLPLFKTEKGHTCLRCSVQMYNSQLGAINVPVNDHWESLTVAEAVGDSVLYATKEKFVERHNEIIEGVK